MTLTKSQTSCGKNVILNLGKNRGAIQKAAVELWTAKYKNDQDKIGLQCFLAGKVTPINLSNLS